MGTARRPDASRDGFVARLVSSGLLVLAGNAGCGLTTSDAPTTTAAGGASSSALAGGAGGATSAGGSGGSSSLGGHGAPDCSDFVPLASPAELATSPREDADAEWLAGEAGDTLVASVPIYDRAHRDLAAIRAQHKRLAEVHPRTPGESVLGLKLDAPSLALAAQGRFGGWTCANLAYGATDVGPLDSSYVFLGFPERRLRYDLLAAQYATIAGIETAWASEGSGDGPDLCLSITGETFSYVFLEAWGSATGDCDAICSSHRFSGFTTDAAGAVTALGELELGKYSGSPEPPGWLAALSACTKWLHTCNYVSYCGPPK